MAGIKTFSSIPVLPASNPTADNEATRKKYVDDNVGSANYTPTSYTGGESVTLPNGLIMKMGVSASVNVNASITITFGVAFPTALVSVTATKQGSLYTSAAGAQSISAQSTSSFTYADGVNQAGTVNWIAIGY